MQPTHRNRKLKSLQLMASVGLVLAGFVTAAQAGPMDWANCKKCNNIQSVINKCASEKGHNYCLKVCKTADKMKKCNDTFYKNAEVSRPEPAISGPTNVKKEATIINKMPCEAIEFAIKHKAEINEAAKSNGMGVVVDDFNEAEITHMRENCFKEGKAVAAPARPATAAPALPSAMAAPSPAAPTPPALPATAGRPVLSSVPTPPALPDKAGRPVLSSVPTPPVASAPPSAPPPPPPALSLSDEPSGMMPKRRAPFQGLRDYPPALATTPDSSTLAPSAPKRETGEERMKRLKEEADKSALPTVAGKN